MADAGLAGQVALVTGASTGIGRQVAEALSTRGAAVAGLARDEKRLGGAMREVALATGGRAIAVAADVTDIVAVEGAVARVIEEYGRIDLLVNCAGLVDAAEVPLWAADPEQWWAVVSSHVRGAQLLVWAVIPGMLDRGSGRIVNMASGMGTRAEPDYSAYSVGKAGLIRLTEAVAASLEGTGVRAFNIAPGLVDTEMTRSMPKWDGFTDWTPPQRVLELVCAVAEGELDAWSGRFLRAGIDSVGAARAVVPEGAARQLRLRPYSSEDPLA